MSRRAFCCTCFLSGLLELARAGCGRAAALAGERERVPTTELELNRFADAYNVYAEQLRRGVVDVKAWERVRRIWREIAE